MTAGRNTVTPGPGRAVGGRSVSAQPQFCSSWLADMTHLTALMDQGFGAVMRPQWRILVAVPPQPAFGVEPSCLQVLGISSACRILAQAAMPAVGGWEARGQGHPLWFGLRPRARSVFRKLGLSSPTCTKRPGSVLSGQPLSTRPVERVRHFDTHHPDLTVSTF